MDATEVNSWLGDPTAPCSELNQQVALAIARTVSAYIASPLWSSLAGFVELHLLDADTGKSSAVEHVHMHLSYVRRQPRFVRKRHGQQLERILQCGAIYVCSQEISPTAYLYLVDRLCLVRWTSMVLDCPPEKALAQVIRRVNKRFHNLDARTYGRDDTELDWFWYILLTSTSFCWQCLAPSSTPLLRCGDCGVSVYCDKVCQRACRRQHKAYCKTTAIHASPVTVQVALLEAADFAAKQPQAQRVRSTVQKIIDYTLARLAAQNLML